MWKKVLAAIAIMVGVFVIGLEAGWFSYRFFYGGHTLLNTATVVQKIQTLSQLITVRYTVEKVVAFDDVKWYGDSRVVIVAHGVVKAGIDLDHLTPADIHISGTKITMTLPRPRIVDVYLDDHQTQVVERSTGILRLFDKDLEQNARAEAVEELRLAASRSGILTEAAQRAQPEIKALLYQLGFTDVEVKSK